MFFNYPLSAFVGQTAFFFMISAVPLALLFLAVLGAIPPLATQIRESGFFGVLPPFFTEFWQEIFWEFHQSQTTTLLSVTVIAAFWSASKGFVAMIRGFQLIYTPQKPLRYFALRGKALCCTVGALITFIVGCLVLGLFQQAVAFLPFFWPGLLLGLAVVCFFVTLGVLLLYLWAPPRASTPKKELPGALFTTLGWIGFSLLYSLYLKNAKGMIYGSLASTVFMMLWLYACIYILFIGAELNLYLQLKKGE